MCVLWYYPIRLKIGLAHGVYFTVPQCPMNFNQIVKGGHCHD